VQGVHARVVLQFSEGNGFSCSGLQHGKTPHPDKMVWIFSFASSSIDASRKKLSLLESQVREEQMTARFC
jgi:hypothetical protein